MGFLFFSSVTECVTAIVCGDYNAPFHWHEWMVHTWAQTHLFTDFPCNFCGIQAIRDIFQNTFIHVACSQFSFIVFECIYIYICDTLKSPNMKSNSSNCTSIWIHSFVLKLSSDAFHLLHNSFAKLSHWELIDDLINCLLWYKLTSIRAWETQISTFQIILRPNYQRSDDRVHINLKQLIWIWIERNEFALHTSHSMSRFTF